MLEDPMTTPLAPLLDALPHGFDFYHLGRIELQKPEPTPFQLHPSDDRIAIGYRIEGEARGVLLILLDEGLDTSTYSEAGNIIASRLVTQLSDQEGWELSLSPPRILNRAELKTLFARSQTHAIARSYTHRQGERAILLQAVLLPATAVPMEAIGNA